LGRILLWLLLPLQLLADPAIDPNGVMSGFFVSLNPSLAAQAQPPGALGLLVPLALMFAIFYFLVIGPAHRRQKKINQMLAELKTGDKVITNGGIYGTIVGLDGDTVQLRIADQVRIKVARSAIAGLQPEPKESS